MAISDEHRDLLRRLQPVGLPDVLCNDCVPGLDGLTIEHAPTCTISLDVDAATDADRAWFEAHPGASYYYRPVTWGEGAQLISMSDLREQAAGTSLENAAPKAAGKVRVELVREGVRARHFEDVFFVAVGP